MAFGVGNGEYTLEKVLSETDTTHRLAFPAGHLHHLITPDHPRPTPRVFWAVDGDGNPFLLRLTVRRDGYLKPEITGDWLRFIRLKNLKAGDRVIFYKHPIAHNNANAALFTITVRRAVWVFNKILGYSEEA